LGAAFLHEPFFLVEDPSVPGHHTAPTVPARLEGFHSRDTVDGVTEEDRMMESPFEDPQEGERVQARSLAHQAGGDREAEESMGHGLAEGSAARSIVIHMDRIIIPGDPRKEDDVRLRDRPSRALPFVPDDQIVE
jgi:hypothetical protein